MKAKLLTLLMALFAIAESAKADFDFTSFSIEFYAQHKTFRDRYYFSLPQTGAEDVKIEEQLNSLEVIYIHVGYNDSECEFAEQLRELKLWYTVYNTQDGGPSENCVWKSFDFFVNEYGYSPVLYPQKGEREIIEGEWLRHDTPKTIMFYVEGKDRMGNTRSLNNGGENYKLNFTVAKSDNIIKFCGGEYKSGLGLTYHVNRADWYDANIYFDDEGNFTTYDHGGVMPAPDDFGQISSLSLYDIYVAFKRAEGLGLNDVDASFMYKVYEEGHGNEVDWNKLDFVELYDNYYFNDTRASIYDPDGNPLINFTEGLELNKNYVLEVYYQVIADEKCYTLGKKEDEGTKLKFTTRTAQIIEGPIKSLMLAYSLGNNDVVYQEMPESEFPEVILQEPISSFKIYGGEAVTEETIQSLDLHAKVTEVDNSDPETAEHIWAVIPFTDNGFGMWTIELPSPRELMLEKWQEEHKRITFELYIQGTDQNGEPVYFNNGGEGYKFTFTCCEDTDRGIKNFTLTIDINGEVMPVPVPATDAEDSEIPFPLSIFRIMKAEVNTYMPMKSVTFFSTLYNTADGVSYDQDAWKMTSFVKQGENSWVIDMPYGKELIEEEWLLQNTRMRKTYQFFVRAEGEDGNDYFFNNGDNMYKITFTCDDADGISPLLTSPEEEEMVNGKCYNLTGQRMSKMQKGINIIGGRKILK